MISTAALFEFFRNEALNARNLFATTGPKPRFRRNQYGFVFGGPIQRNKTFFFVDYQGTRLQTGTVRTSTVPTSLQRQGIFSTPDLRSDDDTPDRFRIRPRPVCQRHNPLEPLRLGRPKRGGPLSRTQCVHQWAGGDGQ